MKLFDLALKDLVRSTRSLFFVGMTLAAPLLLTGLIYFAFGSLASGDVALTPIRVGVVTADRLPAAAPLEAPIGDAMRAMFFDASVAQWLTAVDYPEEAAARAALAAQEIGVAVLIPPTLTADLLTGQATAPITILHDPTLTIAPAVVRDMVTGLVDGVSGGGIAFQTIDRRHQANGRELDPAAIPGLLAAYGDWYAAHQRAFFHTPADAALVVTAPAADEATTPLQRVMGLVMAGQIVFFSFFTGGYAMQSLLEEDEAGTLARLFTTPTDRTVILAGKFLGAAITVLVQGVVLLLAGRLIFGVNWGQPAAVGLALLGQVIAAVGLGVMLIAMLKHSRQAGPVLGGVLTGLGMLGGVMTTNIQMPEAFNQLAAFTPQGWALRTWKLALAGQPAGDLVGPFLVLVGIGAGLFVIGAFLFRRRFA